MLLQVGATTGWRWPRELNLNRDLLSVAEDRDEVGTENDLMSAAIVTPPDLPGPLWALENLALAEELAPAEPDPGGNRSWLSRLTSPALL